MKRGRPVYRRRRQEQHKRRITLTKRDAYTSLAKAIVATAIYDAAYSRRRGSVMSFIESSWCEMLCDWLGLDTETLRRGIERKLGIAEERDAERMAKRDDERRDAECIAEQFVAFVGEEFFEGMLYRSASKAMDSYLRKRGIRWPERRQKATYILRALGSGWRIEWEKGAPNYGHYMRGEKAPLIEPKRRRGRSKSEKTPQREREEATDRLA